MPQQDDPPGPLVPLAAGASSRVCRVGEGRVAKIFHAAVSEEMIAREVDAATLAAEAGLPVARPLRRLDMAEGRAILYPEVTGPTLMRRMRLRPLQSGSCLRDMAALHRRIHGEAAPGLRSLRQVLRTDILYGPADRGLQEGAVALLDGLPDGDRLLHGDFHIGNILLSPSGMVAIDWSKAARGDFVPDLLRTEMLLRFGEGPQDRLTNMARDWAARNYVASYRRLAPALEHGAEWRAVVALAWLRARAPVRQAAFLAYLNRALAGAGLPPYSAMT
ncbi:MULTISPECIES: aminoglycoside phosphotransferase family protein [Sphingobium]|uniref:Aminoglycoside phosphotransferase family protein n=1 Tax=Sphingobium fuliginis ATCC 27551 TaxID=1208342 RepID=A0A5B8CGR3_SPHSA|nr:MULTISPECIES: aminoglycoside phosphotransferase family protein [Sphingobium]QDC38814.1 aminoglycoside phosphotransferase family protein [Sphingobium fuliginis ATCC 27551]UXC90643.1 aminoglycoside phosphotransferase family protein [Sphingobium sp. RSMS]